MHLDLITRSCQLPPPRKNGSMMRVGVVDLILRI
ncbi:hypothetical protein BVRB_6g141980 [Beta vulgaris subsp. vulgaris]|nr:hypothetical protein BVRB_6g141980 [Beta vulgaris subsp. vulgaris]